MTGASVPAPTDEETDEQLMRRVQRDDSDAFEQLFDRHAVRALRVASSVCRDRGRAEDAVQEGFLSLWHGRAGYRPETGSFQAWSMSVVRNRAVDLVQRATAASRPRTVENHEVRRSDDNALRTSLSRLPDAQAEVIALAYFGQLTHTEIADQLDLPAGTVKGRMRLGLEKMRRDLDSSR